jgi:hypothetical protein
MVNFGAFLKCNSNKKMLNSRYFCCISGASVETEPFFTFAYNPNF